MPGTACYLKYRFASAPRLDVEELAIGPFWTTDSARVHQDKFGPRDAVLLEKYDGSPVMAPADHAMLVAPWVAMK